MILTLKTNEPVAQIAIYQDGKQLVNEQWQSNRQLAKTLNNKIAKILQSAGKDLDGLKAVIVYSGPGSFTGLRIGVSVANALGHSLNIPVVATNGTKWVQTGLKKLKTIEKFTPVAPAYGQPAKTTKPKK